MFKDKLKELRLNKGFTQRKMAEMLNISITGYASWEQGISQPSIDYILKICTILGITPNELLEFNYDYNFEYKSPNGTTLIHKEKYKKQ